MAALELALETEDEEKIAKASAALDKAESARDLTSQVKKTAGARSALAIALALLFPHVTARPLSARRTVRALLALHAVGWGAV